MSCWCSTSLKIRAWTRARRSVCERCWKGASDPMAIADHWQFLAQIFAERMLNGTLEGMAIALFGWVLLRALGRQNSNTRFAVWFSALMGIAMLPLFGNMTLGVPVARATQSAFRLPMSWAVDIFVAWAVIAGVG